MALTRKFLTALGIEDDKVDEIISAHTDTVNALKEARDNNKEAAEKLPKVEKELNDLKKQMEDGEENPFEAKYNALKKDFEDYKGKIKADEAKRAKTEAYKTLLLEKNVSEKRIPKIIKLTDLDELELEDGKFKNADALKDEIEKEWSEFIVKDGKEGANTSNPPKNNGGTAKTKEDIMKIKDTSERQAEWAKFIESERNKD